MSRTITMMLLGASLLTVPAFGQYRDDDRYGGYRNDPYGRQYPQDQNGRWGRQGTYGNRGGYGNGGYRNGNNVVDRVQRDLSQIASYSRLHGRDQDRAQRAMSELSRFESKWRGEGRFDKGHLDRAIDNMNDLVRSNQIGPREQNVIRAGRDALRDFRSNGSYSSNGNYGGYRPW